MVCRLCGAANAAQQASCTVCGAPLERAPERRGIARRSEARTNRSLWLAICGAVGAGLGWIVHRAFPAGHRPAYLVISLALGAGLGVLLGLLPTWLSGWLRRAWSFLVFWFAGGLVRRRGRRLQRRCHRLLEEQPDDAELHTRLGCAMWIEGTRDRAEQVMLRALSCPDAPPVTRHNMAVIDAVAGRRTRALELLEAVRSDLSGIPAFHWNLGLLHWALARHTEAVAAFDRVLAEQPEHLPAHNALAIVVALRGDVEDALHQLEAALRVSREDPDTLCTLGVLQQSRADLTTADHYFTLALRTHPAQTAARYNRALCAMLDGRYPAAVDDLAILNRLAPDHARGFCQKAICHYRLGQTTRAMEAVGQALRGQPADFQVRYNTGTLFLRENKIEPAVAELEKAHELEPRDPDVVLNLGVATHLSELPRQALDHFRVAVRMNPRHALARYNCAVVYTLLDLLEEAEKELTALLQLYPDFPEAFNEIGVLYLRTNRLLEATGQFQRAVSAMPRSAPVRANLALAYSLQGDYSAALEQARFATAVDPRLANARDIAGRVAMEMREYGEAIEHFSALVKLEPSNPDAHANLGFAYYKDGRLNDAIECYKRVLIFSPHSPEGHNDLGLAYAKNKMMSESVRHLTQVIDSRPDNPILHSNLGLVYYFKNESENAVERWREVTRLSPQYARKREADRFTAYDDQEMRLRELDLRKRSSHYPLKVAAFRHTFQLSLDENDYRLALPWPDLASMSRWQSRAQRAKQLMLRV